jgi:hypothetical protein
VDLFTRLWQDYAVLIDLVLYFLVFAAAARASFARVFPGRQGRVLAVSVGALLAVSLVLAQRSLGFSLESIGPAAIFIICSVVFLAFYKLLEQARVPRLLAVLLSVLLALVLLRAVLPDKTLGIAREHSLMVLLLLIGLVICVWHSSESQARTFQRRRPGSLLARQHVVPSEDDLRREKRLIRKRLRNPTKANQKDEAAIQTEAEKTQRSLDQESTPKKKQHQFELLDDILRRARRVKSRSQALFRLDDALRRCDLQWLHKAHGIDLSQLTPAQQLILRRGLSDERQRLRVEEKLEQLEAEVNRFSQALIQRVAKAKNCLDSGEVATAQAWIGEAQALDRKILELDAKALTWEKRLLRLVRRQQKELTEIG